VGITYVPTESRKTVVRGGYGLFYDMFAVAFFTANTGFANGGALGVGNNPGGEQPVFSITQRRQTVVNNVPIFGTSPQPRAAGLSQARRPFAAQYPDLAAINELESIGRSEYNSLQLSLIQNAWH